MHRATWLTVIGLPVVTSGDHFTMSFYSCSWANDHVETESYECLHFCSLTSAIHGNHLGIQSLYLWLHSIMVVHYSSTKYLLSAFVHHCILVPSTEIQVNTNGSQ